MTLTIAQSQAMELKHEAEATRRLLRAIPYQHLSWQPHAKSMSLGGLGTHLANIPTWVVYILAQDSLDVAHTGPSPELPSGPEELLMRWGNNVHEALDGLNRVSDEHMAQPWTLLKDGALVFQQPRAAVVRSMVLNHLIHHRGQLTVYLRLLEVPLPSTYGPTADGG